MNKDRLKNILSWVGVIAIGIAVYFGNIEYQSYLGRQAVEETGLTSTRLQSAIADAGKSGKLVLVEVSAIWCGNCRRLDREVLANPDVRQEIKTGFVFSRLEYESDEGQQFLKQRNSDGFPNLWVLDGEGRPVTQLRLTYDPSDFIGQLGRARDQSSNSFSSVNR